MDLVKARFLLENLLERIETLEDGSKQLSGKLTDAELNALQVAISLFDPLSAKMLLQNEPESIKIDDATSTVMNDEKTTIKVELDTSVLDLPVQSDDIRLCLDFGTAMSKAALVENHDDDDFEAIEVLKLGIPGDQEEVNEMMLVSSVFIDDSGLLWFGQRAVDEARLVPEESNRQQLDNIKRYLSEEGLSSKVSRIFNPTKIEITYGDLILSYLTYLTWCVNHALSDLDSDFPKNIYRRFAMPCLVDLAASKAEHKLRQYLGDAQILSDTFEKTLNKGIQIEEFMSALIQLRSKKLSYPFITEKVSEPLGVAGSLLGAQTKTNMLALVVDVGAGTTDFSLYRIAVDPTEGKNSAFEVKDTSKCLTEAGNHLDKLLKNVILKEVGIDSSHPSWANVSWDLEKKIRNYKETLFNEGEVFIYLRESDSEISIKLDDFMGLKQVKNFGDNLKGMMKEIMSSVSHDFIDWIVQEPTRKLVIILTGGGASLPMVQDIAIGTINVHGVEVPLAPARPFPTWLEKGHADLESNYARIAVALGGARKTIIQSGGTMNITSGDGKSKPTLEVGITGS